MEQKSEFFYTGKKWEKVIDIFSENGIEIFYKNHFITLDIDELNEEEKKMWGGNAKEQLPQLLPKLKKSHDEIGKIIEIVSQFITLAEKSKINPDNWLDLNALTFEIDSVREILTRLSYFERTNKIFSPDYGRVPVSFIIGQKEGNVVKYLNLLDSDTALITISGNSSLSLKSEMEKQFV